MEQALALLRLALERGWTLGVLLIVFFASAIWAGGHGVALPILVIEWSGAGLLFGIATLIVSLIANFISYVRAIIIRRRDANGVRREEKAEARANLALLDSNEKATLLALLRKGQSRIEVQITDRTYSLLDKGVLVEVQQHGGAAWVCDLHPGIAAMRAELIKG
jgi:hypothetical protein